MSFPHRKAGSEKVEPGGAQPQPALRKLQAYQGVSQVALRAWRELLSKGKPFLPTGIREDLKELDTDVVVALFRATLREACRWGKNLLVFGIFFFPFYSRMIQRTQTRGFCVLFLSLLSQLPETVESSHWARSQAAEEAGE